MRKLLISTGLATLFLASCTGSVLPSASDDSSSTSSAASAQWVSYEGTIEKLGVNVFMEGTHRLITDDGQSVLLESDTVVLDDYVDSRVRITGSAHRTVEAEGIIVNVDGIERVLTAEEPSVLEESSSSSSSEESSSSSSSMSSSSSLSSFSVSTTSSSSSSVRVSVASVSSAQSAAASVSSASVASAEPVEPVSGVSASAMAKAKVDSLNFTQKYCTSHIGFCIPVHRNWFYVSFGANVAPSLWHVEMSDAEITDAGQGGIMVDLVSGALSGEAEGIAMAKDGKLVAYRQWTGNRHFEVSGPTELKAAIEYIAQNLSTAE